MSMLRAGHEPLPTRPAVRFEDEAKVALANTQLRRNMGKATQTIRAKRSAVVQEMPDWEALREAGRAIKAALEQTVLLELLPRSQVDVSVQVLQADGGSVAACINAARLALADAGNE